MLSRPTTPRPGRTSGLDCAHGDRNGAHQTMVWPNFYIRPWYGRWYFNGPWCGLSGLPSRRWASTARRKWKAVAPRRALRAMRRDGWTMGGPNHGMVRMVRTMGWSGPRQTPRLGGTSKMPWHGPLALGSCHGRMVCRGCAWYGCGPWYDSRRFTSTRSWHRAGIGQHEGGDEFGTCKRALHVCLWWW